MGLCGNLAAKSNDPQRAKIVKDRPSIPNIIPILYFIYVPFFLSRAGGPLLILAKRGRFVLVGGGGRGSFEGVGRYFRRG